MPTDSTSGAVDIKLLLTPWSKGIFLVFHSNKSCFREGYVDAVLLSIAFASLTVGRNACGNLILFCNSVKQQQTDE